VSRIGLSPIKIEEGVTVEVQKNAVKVTGPLGNLSIEYPSNLLTVEVKDGQVLLSRVDDAKFTKSVHGTIRSIVANAVKGVKSGYEKKLELVGVGYRVKKEGTDKVSFTLGFTHPVVFQIPAGISVEVPDEVTVIIKGYDKQVVGQLAAKIRSKRKPEPYKGKGIKYSDEIVKRKSSKAAATKK
jgi:large subunit ribosomal protein L6